MRRPSLPSVHEEPEVVQGLEVSNTESEDPSNHRQEHRIEPTPHACSTSGQSGRCPSGPLKQDIEPRQCVEQELLRQPQSHAAPVAKRLIHIAINATITTTAKFITDQQYTFTPPLADLVTKAHEAADAVCQYLSEQPTSHRPHCTLCNRNFYNLESIEAAYIMHIIQGLQQAQPQCSLVLLHDGLLVSPLPTQSTLARLHDEALHLVGLPSDDTPFLLTTNHGDTYTQIVRQLPPTTPHIVQALHSAIAAVNLAHLYTTSSSGPTNAWPQCYATPPQQLPRSMHTLAAQQGGKAEKHDTHDTQAA